MCLWGGGGGETAVCDEKCTHQLLAGVQHSKSQCVLSQILVLWMFMS